MTSAEKACKKPCVTQSIMIHAKDPLSQSHNMTYVGLEFSEEVYMFKEYPNYDGFNFIVDVGKNTLKF